MCHSQNKFVKLFQDYGNNCNNNTSYKFKLIVITKTVFHSILYNTYKSWKCFTQPYQTWCIVRTKIGVLLTRKRLNLINHVIIQLYLTRIAKHNVISSITINVLNARSFLRHVHRPCETAAVLQKLFFIYFAAQKSSLFF